MIKAPEEERFVHDVFDVSSSITFKRASSIISANVCGEEAHVIIQKWDKWVSAKHGTTISHMKGIELCNKQISIDFSVCGNVLFWNGSGKSFLGRMVDRNVSSTHRYF